MGEVIRRLGLNALATLPLWIAIGGVVVVARDLTEIAAAAIGGAVLISLAGLVAIWVATRRSTRVAREHDVVVQQSLAMIDCMKEINRRVMSIEAGAQPAPAGLDVVTDMHTPDAENDPGQNQPEHMAPVNMVPEHMAELVQAAPAVQIIPEVAVEPAFAPAPYVAPVAVTLPVPVAVPAAPASPPVAAPVHQLSRPVLLRPVPVVPAAPLPRYVEHNISDLHDGRVLGQVLAAFPGQAQTDEAGVELIALAIERLASGEESVEVSLPAAPGQCPQTVEQLIIALKRQPSQAPRWYIGLSPQALRAGGVEQAKVLARLAQCGVQLALTDVRDRSLNGAAMHDCGITRMSASANWLMAEVSRTPAETTRWLADLATHGVQVVITGITQPNVIPILTALGLTAGFGPGLDSAMVEETLPPQRRGLPWRAQPRRFANGRG